MERRLKRERKERRMGEERRYILSAREDRGYRTEVDPEDYGQSVWCLLVFVAFEEEWRCIGYIYTR